MALTSATFSTSQSAGDLSSVLFTDTSTGSEPSLTGRFIYCRKYNGAYLVPTDVTVTYIFWPIGDATILVENLLDKDYCLEVSVVWVTGSTASYTTTVLTLFTGYSDVFLRQLTSNVASNRGLISNQNYWQNKIKLRTLIDDAGQGVLQFNDQTIAQFCLDEAKKLTDNINTFF